MEEEMLKVQKLNIIDKIQKRLAIRKIKRDKEIESWKQIRNPKIKYDFEVMELAWENEEKGNNGKNYGEFPKSFQTEKGKENKSIISYLDKEVQEELVKQNIDFINSTSEDVQEKLLKEDPTTYIDRIGDVQKRKIILKNPSLIQFDYRHRQGNYVEENPALIIYCSNEVKVPILRNKSIKSEEWQAMLRNEPNLTVSKIVKCFKNSASMIQEKGEVFAEFLNSSSNKENIIKQISELDEENKKDILSNIAVTTNFLDIESQKAIFDTLVNKADINFKRFDEKTLEDKFEERYGKDKLAQYREFIETMKNNQYLSSDSRIFNLLYNESSIVDKVEPNRLMEYFQMNLMRKDEKIKRENAGIYGIYTTSEKIKEIKLREKFKDIINDAYGEKAVKILEKRPGLNLWNIDNTEVFSPEILENFREGFVHDLLSYDIENSDEFIKLTKNKEDLEAFKMYYGRMSEQLGENVVTMQMCISRYGEYSEILKQASHSQLTEEQLAKLDGLCSWPENICEIKNIDELDELEEKLNEKLKEKPELYNLKDDILNQNLGQEEIIYGYKNLKDEDLYMLTEDEKQLFRIMQEKDFSLNNILTLRGAASNGIELSTIFLNKYKALNKVKEKQIKDFNGSLTNRTEIENAIREGRDNVRKIVIDGVEIIDLGDMKCNFASHNPYMNNSFVNTRD